MQVINTLLGGVFPADIVCKCPSRGRCRGVKEDRKGPAQVWLNMLEGLVRLWLCSLPAVYVHIWPGGSVGLEMHLTFLVGVLVPVMVWFSCHGSVVPGIKDAQCWYSVAPECKPLGHYFIYSGAGAQGDWGGSFSDRCLCWYISRVSMLMPN